MTARGWALVTGATRRIGAALALAAGEAGFDVVVHHRGSAAGARETVGRIEALGQRAVTAACDLANPADCKRLVAEAPSPITLLVNSASLFEEDSLETLNLAPYEATMAVNLRAPLLLSQAMARALPADRTGHIVNILDQRVWRLNPRFFTYTLSKAALWTATQTLAQALAPRIRVNAIGPGPTLPSIHQSADDFVAQSAASPLERGPTPEDIAGALGYLIDAVSVTGQMIAVDGGQHLAWRTPDVLHDG
ncbi:MAG TPA: SDR family oxidoreductase [Caulobacteraceae bacterium]|jgi:NAD(P)-dependent dehydrogenase (short-subunit alcohol dehydrogenase family)